MIRATSSIDGPPLTFTAIVSGFAVYLDNWAVNDLAEGDPSRRKRFVDGLCAGGDLIFSVANAAELSGPQGESIETVRTFLDEIGPHWFPVELDVFEVMERERMRKKPDESSISIDFMHAYFRARTNNCKPGSGNVIDLSKDFFSLGAVLDWVGPQRDSIRETSAKFDEVLGKAILDARIKHKQKPIPDSPFDAAKRATFASINLVKILVLESNQMKKGDGLDFCHAVMGSAFASFATLDKNWKRRITSLPKPNGLAHIYGPLELDQMVTDMESWVNSNQHLVAGRQ
jgi:hypothetical protein